jgi:type IV secretion system protein TrbF
MRLFPRTRPRTAPTQAPDAPYGYAAQIEAHFVTQAHRHARAWQWGCVGLGTLAGIFGVCLLLQSMQATVTPYVVEVDQLGTVKTVGPAQVPYVPSEAVVRRHVREFVLATRSVSTDVIVVRRLAEWAFAVCTARGGQLLSAALSDRAINKDLGKKAVAVEIQRMVFQSDAQANPTTLDVTWQETTYSESGQVVTQETWSGLYTVIQRAPTTEAEVQANPLGLWIDHFSASKLL